jgi:hypothetical protein
MHIGDGDVGLWRSVHLGQHLLGQDLRELRHALTRTVRAARRMARGASEHQLASLRALLAQNLPNTCPRSRDWVGLQCKYHQKHPEPCRCNGTCLWHDLLSAAPCVASAILQTCSFSCYRALPQAE